MAYRWQSDSARLIVGSNAATKNGDFAACTALLLRSHDFIDTSSLFVSSPPQTIPHITSASRRCIELNLVHPQGDLLTDAWMDTRDTALLL